MIRSKLFLIALTMLNCNSSNELILFTQRRNYKNTNFLLINKLSLTNLLILTKHTALRPSTLFDITTYVNSKHASAIPAELRLPYKTAMLQQYSIDTNVQTMLLAELDLLPRAIPRACPAMGFYLREVSEMFKWNHYDSVDTRPLLLDYGNISAPMLPNNAVWGSNEYVFDTFRDRVEVVPTSVFTI